MNLKTIVRPFALLSGAMLLIALAMILVGVAIHLTSGSVTAHAQAPGTTKPNILPHATS